MQLLQNTSETQINSRKSTNDESSFVRDFNIIFLSLFARKTQRRDVVSADRRAAFDNHRQRQIDFRIAVDALETAFFAAIAAFKFHRPPARAEQFINRVLVGNFQRRFFIYQMPSLIKFLRDKRRIFVLRLLRLCRKSCER